jgi:hypothetical protein
MVNDRPARRARQEYSKAVAAYQDGDEADAAYYLGAMGHRREKLRSRHVR